MTRRDSSTLSAVKLALAARRVRERESEDLEMLESEPIAVTAVGCRFPKANGPQAFWKMLVNGEDGIAEVPPARFSVTDFFDQDPAAPGRMNTRFGGFIEDIDRFDAGFFGISPREAACMDPQQRMLLQVAWETLEAGGHATAELAGSRTGVFIGISTGDYAGLQFNEPVSIDAYASTGNAHSIVANRLSYTFDLRGPSLAVDTACSSSLVAVHLACQSLRRMECDLALAGGVNLILSPGWTISFSKFGMMAPDGRCKTFDARADGFVRGEGIGAVALRRLSDAIASGDPLLAVIRGTAVNQDGMSNGLTAPNLGAQEAVIRASLRQGRVEPSRIQYIEAHGTGTALGDPIEVAALAATVGASGPDSGSCILGSVKTNIGHLEAAAGIAGLIKAILALKNRRIPGNLHFQKLNPHIDLEGTRFVIPVETVPWPDESAARFAAVSSFGFGGTNAHVVLEEAPVLTSPPRESGPQLLPLSARSGESLRDLAAAFRTWLDSAGTSLPLRDIAFTASGRRSHHSWRVAVAGNSTQEWSAALSAWLHQSLPRPGGGRPRLAFVYPGQGSDWAGEGIGLLGEPAFHEAMTDCDRRVRSMAGWSPIDELQAGSASTIRSDGRIAQPLLFCFQVALTALWRDWGIDPDVVVGHSVGEVAAAHSAGVLDLDSALRVVLERARLMQQAAGLGAMAVVDASPAEAAALVARPDGSLWIAAENSPLTTVLAGLPSAVQSVLAASNARGVFCRSLPVDFAFHSPQMEPFRQPLIDALTGLNPGQATVPIVSSALGRYANGGEFTAAYWGFNLRERVRFRSAVDAILRDDVRHFLEIGPRAALARAIQQCGEAAGSEVRVWSSLRKGRPEALAIRETAGGIYAEGGTPRWEALTGGPANVVDLPSYPWRPERHWFEVRQERLPNCPVAVDRHPLLARRIHLAHLRDEFVWESELDSSRLPWLNDHRVRGVPVVPGAAVIEAFLSASGEAFANTDWEIDDLQLLRTLSVPPGEVRTVQVRLSSSGSPLAEIYSRGPRDPNWSIHARATLVPSGRTSGALRQ